ncbi:MAG: DUF1540 domain-containing protein [Spirochaetes bacterium]|nr:DUF1540 domain-containing protein [Spirochaetota bacterium]
MPNISSCENLACAYNCDNKCNAMTVIVSENEGTKCDTQFSSAGKADLLPAVGFVAACCVTDCRYNNTLKCRANGIRIVLRSDHAECGTYLNDKIKMA